MHGRTASSEHRAQRTKGSAAQSTPGFILRRAEMMPTPLGSSSHHRVDVLRCRNSAWARHNAMLCRGSPPHTTARPTPPRRMRWRADSPRRVALVPFPDEPRASPGGPGTRLEPRSASSVVGSAVASAEGAWARRQHACHRGAAYESRARAPRPAERELHFQSVAGSPTESQ